MLNNRPRTRGAIIVRITLAKTVQRIAERSFVQWHAGSEGLGLILTPQGYELTATPERYNGARCPIA